MDKRGLTDLLINRIPGISSREKIFLGMQFDQEETVAKLSKKDVEKLLGRSLDKPWTMDALRVQAGKDAAAAGLRGIASVSHGDPRYPPLLREIWDPPALLFYRGTLPNPEQPLAAVVGTRHPSGQAAAHAYDIARDLGLGGIPVVSGLALGIDALAHRGNLEGGGATAAVLGSGLDQVYPASNRGLARRILETGGVLLSEYPPGTEPKKWHFPARNRIISGLARGVLIVEAPASSGALITARFALEQNRDLWVASSGIASARGAGTIVLAGEGARVISGARIIFDEWGITRRTDRGYGNGIGLAQGLARVLNIVCEE